MNASARAGVLKPLVFPAILRRRRTHPGVTNMARSAASRQTVSPFEATSEMYERAVEPFGLLTSD